MASAAAETLIGAVVLAAAGGFLVYAAQTADIRGGSDGYEVVAKFVRADGLTVGGDVRMAGVKIGTITSFELDNTTFEAVATMQIRDEIAIPQGSSALVASDGLLGGATVAIEPGNGDDMMMDGEEFLVTQGSVNLLDLFSKAIAGNTGE